MRRMVWLLVLLPVLAALVVAGCGGGDEEGGAGGTTTGGEGPSGEPIKIGASLPLTGDFSEPGVAARQGYEIWAKQVNDAGGLLGRPVQIVVKDDQSDQNVVVSDYNALINQDKVDLLLGTFSSLLNLPASAVAERAGMLYVEPAGGSPEMFSRGFQYLFFSQQATAEHQADLFSEWVTGLDTPPKTAAYLPADDPFGGPVADGIQKKLEAAGVQTVFSKVYPPETVNFDAIASAIAAKKPDVIAQGSAGLQDGVNFIRALKKVGYSPKEMFVASAPSFADQFSDAVGIDNTEGIFYAVSYHVDAPTPGNKEFLAAYRAKFKTDPPEDAADGYAAAQVLQAAVEAVGSIDDQEALADWLRNNSVDTILGTLSWDDTGAPEQAFLLAQWQNGDEEIVLPEDAATTDTIVDPKPPWSGGS
jgi:branched-chain amino acid transport system substrate-binding protein